MSGINGFVALVIGIILLIWPKETLAVLAVLLGIWLIISAILQFVAAVSRRRDDADGAPISRTAGIISALIYLITGIFCLFHPFTTVSVLAAIVGVTLLLVGAAAIFSSRQRKAGWRRGPQLIFGIVSMIGGLIVLIWPSVTLLAIVKIAGILLIGSASSKSSPGSGHATPSPSCRPPPDNLSRRPASRDR